MLLYMKLKFNLKKDIVEFVPIILWKDNLDLLNLVKQKFNVVEIVTLSFNKDEMKKKLNELYYPYNVKDQRCECKTIQILILKLINPEYKIFNRKEHIDEPLNKTVIDFKEKTRKIYNHLYFHSADNLTESQHTFKVFKLNKYINNEKFIKIDDLHATIWLNNRDSFKYREQVEHFCLKKVSKTPHYLYLKNDKKHYIKYLEEKDPSHKAKKYDSLINSINSREYCETHINRIIIPISFCTKSKKYTIADGLHRASIYLNNDIKYIKCKKINDDHLDDHFKNTVNHIHEHYYEFLETMKELDQNKVRYVIVRGFKTLPLSPDTDLDVICHPDDLDKLRDIMLKRLSIISKKEITMDSKNVNYIQFKTNNIPNEDIKNTYFHIDIYDNVFFFYKKHICVSEILNILFENRIKFLDNCYIPTPEFEYFLLILRVCFDVGKLRDKHKNRLSELIPLVENKNNLFNYLKPDEMEFLRSKLISLKNVPIVKDYPKINN